MSVLGTAPHSVQKLAALHSEIDTHVNKKWWSLDEIDTSRWRRLADLIEWRKKEAKENLTRAILTEIGAVRKEHDGGPTRQHERYAALTERAWKHLENGELDEAQHNLLMKVISESPGGLS